MLRWLGGVAAVVLSCGASAAAGEPPDCAAAPNMTCLAAQVFALAKTLPDAYFRRHVEFAEQELALGDIKVALQYVVADNPDAPPWEDVDWIAQAGLFDRAIALANQRVSPVERLGGLVAVAKRMLDKNQTARAARIVDEVERDLPSAPVGENIDDAAISLRLDTGEIRARLGQTERAARLLGGFGGETVSYALTLAAKYPTAAGLRELAWRETERVNEPYAWQFLVEDAVARADQADIAQSAQRAVTRLEGTVDHDHAYARISLARALLTAGVPELSARLIKPWPKWVDGQDATRKHNTLVQLIPLLVDLAQDKEVDTAAHAPGSGFDRSRWLSLAAEEYFRIGRSDAATRFDREALLVAASLPTAEPKLQWEHDAALQNLALARAGHADIQGALDVAGKLGDEMKIREAVAAIVRRAIDEGQGPVAGPAIEALQQHARATQDSGTMLRAAGAWYEVGNEAEARSSLDEAVKIAAEPNAAPASNDSGFAAELTWRVTGRGEPAAMLAIADKLGVNDPGAIDHLVEIMTPVSPVVAVQLAARQTEIEHQIDDLAGIGIAIAEGKK
jgi:tetratricopeptide (TPR) repeat protein